MKKQTTILIILFMAGSVWANGDGYDFSKAAKETTRALGGWKCIKAWQEVEECLTERDELYKNGKIPEVSYPCWTPACDPPIKPKEPDCYWELSALPPVENEHKLNDQLRWPQFRDGEPMTIRIFEVDCANCFDGSKTLRMYEVWLKQKVCK